MLSKTAEYALRMVTCLGRDRGRPESAERLAAETRVPRRYLHTVLQDLVRAELVRSRPGPGGGYALARPADEITILDVVNAVAPLQRIRHCPLGLPTHTSLCPLHRELDRAFEAVETSFARVTIGRLLDSTAESAPLCDVAPR